jgi:hypothetical protein
MGKMHGDPVRLTTPSSAQRALQAYQDEMLRQAQQANQMALLRQQMAMQYRGPANDLDPRMYGAPRDLHIAGQVFDGVTGERKR